MNMRLICAAVLFATTVQWVCAGDDASGPIPYSVDLSEPFTTYSMTQKDRLWSDSLIANLKYKGPVVHFVRTSLLLKMGGARVEGAVYQAAEKPEFFYVVNGDAILKLDTKWAYSPGVGGFSMHAPKSRRFIVCLNLGGGVPFLSSSRVKKGVVTWNGHTDPNRFEWPERVD